MIRKVISGRPYVMRMMFQYNHIANDDKSMIMGGQEYLRDPTKNILKKQGDNSGLEENEIEARIVRVLQSYEKVDLKNINWQGDFQKDLGLDSLERIAILTSIEHEFTVLWEDRVFDNMHSLEQVKSYLARDSNAI